MLVKSSSSDVKKRSTMKRIILCIVSCLESFQSLPLANSSLMGNTSVEEHFDGDVSILLIRINSNCWMDSMLIVFKFRLSSERVICYLEYRYRFEDEAGCWYTSLFFCEGCHGGWNLSKIQDKVVTYVRQNRNRTEMPLRPNTNANRNERQRNNNTWSFLSLSFIFAPQT